MHTERFAPSPTGLLHLGHAYSAAIAHRAARKASGQFLLRMEDLDASRCRPEFYTAIEQDLAWLGLHWDGEILWQSRREHAYVDAVSKLDALGLLYRCNCTRKDIQAAVSAPQEGVMGETLYPGTCRNRSVGADQHTALRMDMARAVEQIGGDAALQKLEFVSADERGPAAPYRLSAETLLDHIGDVVLRRKDGAAAYHLAVVVDDAHQAVTDVTRGKDLFAATYIHRLLQHLLGLDVPRYMHHDLVRDENGKRLAKRDDARSIRTYREAGESPQTVLELAGLRS